MLSTSNDTSVLIEVEQFLHFHGAAAGSAILKYISAKRPQTDDLRIARRDFEIILAQRFLRRRDVQQKQLHYDLRFERSWTVQSGPGRF
jgi:hypothetical protein